MNRNQIICFRLDPEINRRIACVLRSRYSTRSKFIRTAIEQLLERDEDQARLRAAQSMIQWS
jgi:Arc/MetJ-type ribon-helix-helix transcriptional regulator